ncbi:MAG: carbohydrate ABC transporter permease [Salinispira sp.]
MADSARPTAQGPSTRLVLSIIRFIATIIALIFAFIIIGNKNIPTIINTILVLFVGIGGIWLFYWTGNSVAEQISEKKREKIVGYFYVFPALFMLGIYLVYPAFRTIFLSFFDRTGDIFLGLQNYIYIFSNPRMHTVLRNTFLWVIIVPIVTVALGLTVAVITDKLRATAEKMFKACIFLPMAISFVGASIIFRFIYYKSPFGEEIGLLNAIRQAGGNESIAWLIQEPWNNFFLMFIMIWLLTGFAMVILSAAIKNVPAELHEAAKIDGANVFRIFFQITIPYIRNTLIMVLTTILFMVLKAFDVVFVMTSGDYNTDVVASAMYDQTFQQGNFGTGSALAVLLFIVVLPFVIQNIRNMKNIGGQL